jgi:hypothetical protein
MKFVVEFLQKLVNSANSKIILKESTQKDINDI